MIRPMEDKALTLYARMLKVGLIGFGGGSALIPLLYRETVGSFIDEKAFNEDVTAASVTPGALPVEIASGIGGRLAGRLGMLLSALAIALPGAVATTLLLSSGMLEILWVRYLSAVVSAWVIILLLRYVVETQKKWLIILVFLVTCGKNMWKLLPLPGSPIYLTTLQVFLIAFVVQFIQGGLKLQLSRELLKDVMFLFAPVFVLLVLFPEAAGYAGRGCLSILMSFGGGDAYLTVVDGIFIDTGILSSDDFYGTIVPLVNLLPGSILCKTLPAIGFMLGGWSWAAAGLLCSIAVSCSVFCAARSIEMQKWDWIRPVVSGLMCTVALSLINQIMRVVSSIL